MNYTVKQITPQEWKEYLLDFAFPLAFGVRRPAEMERIDYAIIAIDHKSVFSGFITCKVMDGETLYWQFGGPSPACDTPSKIIEVYLAAISWTRSRYKRILTRIENTNIPMLKLAIRVGFIIIGTVNMNNKIYLELLNEF